MADTKPKSIPYWVVFIAALLTGVAGAAAVVGVVWLIWSGLTALTDAAFPSDGWGGHHA